MLRCCLYSTLHLAGVRQQGTDELAVRLDDIRRFRQLGSRCPGHPEHGHTSGVETTTGPLGQGVANSVGMAIASRWLAATYNRPGYDLFGFNVYALCSDGDMMEGLSGEAASLAGHLRLSNLCWIYDDNGITIEGSTGLAFSEDVAARFSGYGWNVVEVEDVNDLDALRGAIGYFQETTHRPTLVIVKSRIGFGSPNKEGTAEAHGAPLGADEVRPTKQAYHWPGQEDFYVPEEVVRHFAEGIGARGEQLRAAWDAQYAAYAKEYPELAAQIEMIRKRRAARGLGRRHPVVSGRRQGRGQPGFVGQGAQPGGQEHPLDARRLGRPRTVEQVAARIPRGGRFPRRRARPDAISTSASASTPWPPSPTAWPCAACGPTPRRSSSSPTTCGPRRGWRRSWACPCSTSSPTTRSAWARTARRTSRSSSWRRSGRFPTWW